MENRVVRSRVLAAERRGEPRIGAPTLRGQAEEREDGDNDDDEELHRCLLDPFGTVD